jgi:hypothetical protein
MMRSEDEIKIAADVISCRMLEEEQRLSVVQYAIMVGMVAALSWVKCSENGFAVQALLDGEPIIYDDCTEQTLEALRQAIRSSDASRN